MTNTRFPAFSSSRQENRISLLGVPDAKSPAPKDLRHAFNAVEGVILNFLILIREELLPL